MKKLDIIILCGGLGKRIKTKSKDLPKILIEIENKVPFIEFLLKSLKVENFKKIILSIGYRRNKLIQYIKKNQNLNLYFSVEKSPLGTGGAIKKTLNNLTVSDPFFFVNGDTYFNCDIKKILKSKKIDSKKSFILLKKSEKIKRFDQFKIIKNRLTMIDKEAKGENLMNSGFYLFFKKDFQVMKKKFSIESDVIPGLIKKNKICYLINKSKIFFDIGIPKDLNKFKQYIKKNKLINSRNFKQ